MHRTKYMYLQVITYLLILYNIYPNLKYTGDLKIR